MFENSICRRIETRPAQHKLFEQPASNLRDDAYILHSVCVCVFFNVLILVSILFDFYTAVNKVYDSFVQLVCTVLSEYRAQRHFAVIAASI